MADPNTTEPASADTPVRRAIRYIVAVIVLAAFGWACLTVYLDSVTHPPAGWVP